MKAVVMAGGEGTRLRPLTLDVPKPFIRVSGRPAIEYALGALVSAGIRDIIVTTFYKPERLITHLGGGARLNARIFYSVEDEAMGTAGGVAKCLPLIGDDTVVVLSGDVIADVDIAKLVKFHKDRGAEATMAVTQVDNPSEFGIVGTDETGRITRFLEKPKKEEAFSNLINAGIYVLEASALRSIPAGATFDFSKQLFPKLLEEGRKLYAAQLDGFWMDVGRPADLLKASAALGKRHHKEGRLRDSAKVDAGARVSETDLYAGSVVESGAEVADCILFDGARIEGDAKVSGTILAPEAVVGRGATVRDCVLGRGAHVKPGAKLEGVKVEPHSTAG
jgi:NDP-sugar pyrophosphorylase family protein